MGLQIGAYFCFRSSTMWPIFGFNHPKSSLYKEANMELDCLGIETLVSWWLCRGEVAILPRIGPYGSKGDKIHATVGKPNIYLFGKDLKEGGIYSIVNLLIQLNGANYRTSKHQHSLVFQKSSKVTSADSNIVQENLLSFEAPVDVFNSAYDNDFLVDVIGILMAVGVEKKFEKNGAFEKLNVIELDCDGYRFKCTLFESYVDELNSILSSSDNDNVAIAILFAKIKPFQGSWLNLSLLHKE